MVSKNLMEYKSKPKPYEVRLRFDKETKGAVRFVELNDEDQPVVTDVDGAAISFIYLRKRALPSIFGSTQVPRALTIRLQIE